MAEEVVLSRADTIRAALDGVKERDSAPVEKPAPVAAEAEAEAPAGEAVEKPTLDAKPRDPATGKYVGEAPKKGRPTNAERQARLDAIKQTAKNMGQPKPAPQAETAPKPEGDAKPAQEAKPETAKPAQDDTVPGALKAHLKMKWSELTPEWKDEIRRLESVGSGVANRFGPEIALGREMKQTLAPYEQMIAAEGGTPATAVKAVLDLVSTMKNGNVQQKQNALLLLAQQYQVPLNGEASADTQAVMQNPYVANLVAENKRLMEEGTKRKEAEQRAANEANMKILQDFVTEKDAKGNLIHPVDESIAPRLWQHLSVVSQEHPEWDARRRLEAAYENLSWTVPELRAARLAEETAKRQAETAKALEAKKQAAVQVKGSPPADSASSKPNPKDRRSVIAHALASSR